MLKGGGNIVIHIFEIVMVKFKIDFSSKQQSILIETRSNFSITLSITISFFEIQSHFLRNIHRFRGAKIQTLGFFLYKKQFI